MRRSMASELFRISDLRFQIEETPNSNANADPSFVFPRAREAADKGIRDDSVRQGGAEKRAGLYGKARPCDENANAKTNAKANADPSPLKRVRDDGVNQSQKPHAQLRRMGHPDPNANATANLHCAGALGVEFVC
jgi:hypothetical protein